MILSGQGWRGFPKYPRYALINGVAHRLGHSPFPPFVWYWFPDPWADWTLP